MERMPNVVIVLARCMQFGQDFGIRFEEVEPRNWIGNWAFPIREDLAKRESYDRSTVSGSMQFSDDYPGCPSCHACSIFRCKCGGVACWDGVTGWITCPWCHNSGELRGTIESLSAGLDR